MRSQSHDDWESIPADPDPKDDLGYVETEWDIIRTKRRRTSHLLFLPQEEQLLKQEAFIIATESAVVNTADYR